MEETSLLEPFLIRIFEESSGRSYKNKMNSNLGSWSIEKTSKVGPSSDLYIDYLLIFSIQSFIIDGAHFYF